MWLWSSMYGSYQKIMDFALVKVSGSFGIDIRPSSGVGRSVPAPNENYDTQSRLTDGILLAIVDRLVLIMSLLGLDPDLNHVELDFNHKLP